MWHRLVKSSSKTYVCTWSSLEKSQICTEERGTSTETGSSPLRPSFVSFCWNYGYVILHYRSITIKQRGNGSLNVCVCFQESEDVIENSTFSKRQRVGLERLGLMTTMRSRQSFRLQGNHTVNPTPEKVAYHGTVTLTPC